MSIEAGVLIDIHDQPIYWHLPLGRSMVSLPDTRRLWDIIWESRTTLAGFAHSHPGEGVPVPSQTDITTFYAIEQALGRKLQWWITSESYLILCSRIGDFSKYESCLLETIPSWLEGLRRISI